MKDITIILDNGHGTPPLTGGKKSPDSSLKEAEYTREIVRRISKRLNEMDIKNIILVPEEKDIDLYMRCRRVNDIVKKGESSKYLLISVHVNALGDGKDWNDAKGWECWVYRECSENSNRIGQFLCESADAILSSSLIKSPVRNNKKPQKGGFYIIKNTKCPAVLTENLFMTNMKETEWLLSEEGMNMIAYIHLDAIKKYIN